MCTTLSIFSFTDLLFLLGLFSGGLFLLFDNVSLSGRATFEVFGYFLGHPCFFGSAFYFQDLPEETLFKPSASLDNSEFWVICQEVLLLHRVPVLLLFAEQFLILVSSHHHPDHDLGGHPLGNCL